MKDLLLQFQRGEITLNQLKEDFYPQLNEIRRPNWRALSSDVVMYSYRASEYDHINSHEIKRLDHSISSLRNFNSDIKVYLFCDYLSIIPDHFRYEYSVNVRPFFRSYDPNMLNAWSIHRWYNMEYFENRNYNILYVDSDTVFYDDVKYLFHTYSTHDVYGKEERGFRHCPIVGSAKDIRFNLDLVDACIYAEQGRTHIYKYCIGVLLFNNNIHQKIINRLDQLTTIMEKLKANQMLNPIPNPRILDQYAIWIILSRAQASCGLFGVQDVTHSYLEQKHKEYFNPILLHYTTRDEQEFARSDKRFNNLIRDVDDLGIQIDPHSMV